MSFAININTDEFVVFANKLEKISRSAMPNAVRNTLNGMAFDVKKNTMLKSSEKNFTNRQKNFFKANSRVETAKGFDIHGMSSKVGFKSLGAKNTAVDDLEFQERGGKIKKREFVPVKGARPGKNIGKLVSKKNRLGRISKVVKVGYTPGKTGPQKFVKSVLKAGKGGHVLTDKSMIRVNNIRRTKKGLKFTLKTLYSYEKNRSVKIKATHFMEKATEQTSKKGRSIFNKEGAKQFKRFTT